jgi:hypothetical protein
MKVQVVLLIGCLATSFAVRSQKNFIRTYYDKWFPHNKSIQLAQLHEERDSLKLLIDSLYSVQGIAIDKINALKKESVTLKGELVQANIQQKILTDSIEKQQKHLIDSIQSLQFYIVNCTEELITKSGEEFPTIVNTCKWRNLVFIETGVPDGKGRYGWESQIFSEHSGGLHSISKADLFITSQLDQLLSLINKRLEEDFLVLKETEPLCFDRNKNFSPFKFEDFRISLAENGTMNFEVLYQLPENCFEINAASASFMMKELRPYLKNAVVPK